MHMHTECTCAREGVRVPFYCSPSYHLDTGPLTEPTDSLRPACQQALETCLTVHQAKVIGMLRHTWFVNVVLEIQIQGLMQQGSDLLSLSTAPETWASIAPDAGLELKILLPLC